MHTRLLWQLPSDWGHASPTARHIRAKEPGFEGSERSQHPPVQTPPAQHGLPTVPQTSHKPETGFTSSPGWQERLVPLPHGSTPLYPQELQTPWKHVFGAGSGLQDE